MDNMSKNSLSATGKDEDARNHLAFYRFVIDNLPVALPYGRFKIEDYQLQSMGTGNDRLFGKGGTGAVLW